MKNTGRLLLLFVACIMGSACALRSPVLHFPEGRVYGEASVGVNGSMDIVSTKASDKPRSFNDPDYGWIRVVKPKGECDSHEPNCPGDKYFAQADVTYSIGNEKIRLAAGTAVVWLADDMYHGLTGYNEDPWDKWYYAGIKSKRFIDPFIGLETTFGKKNENGRKRGYLLAAIGFPKAGFDWVRQVCDQDHNVPFVPIPGLNDSWSFTCGAENRQGTSVRGTSARVRFMWNDINTIIGLEYTFHNFNPMLAGERMRYQSHTFNLLIWPR